MLKIYEAKIDGKFIMKTWREVYDFMKMKYKFFKSMTWKAFPSLAAKSRATNRIQKAPVRGIFCQCRCRHVQTVDGKFGTQKSYSNANKKVLRPNCRSKLNQIGRFSWTRACQCNSESLLNIYFSCLFPDQEPIEPSDSEIFDAVSVWSAEILKISSASLIWSFKLFPIIIVDN